jgi:hypothetical protein
LTADGKHPAWHRYWCESNGCVEVAQVGAEIYIRNSNEPDGPMVKFSRDEWDVFVAGIRAGDLPLGET